MTGLDWITPEQRETLGSGAWGGDWPEFLHQRLAVLLPEWEQLNDDQRREWLDGVVLACGLGWVTVEQRAELMKLHEAHGDWRSWLPAVLDEQWPEWIYATPGVLVSWLDQWIAVLVGPRGEDVRLLGWVSETQRQWLSASGGWQSWLPAKLDELWPEWTEATPEVLTGWLDDWLPSLVPASREDRFNYADAVQKALREAIDAGDFEPEVLEALAANPELRDLLATQIIELTAAPAAEEVRA